jgi:cell wall-associated NlpC family hydrolase
MATLDPRLNAYRADLADARLKGKIEAARFVEGERRRVVVDHAPMRPRAAHEEPIASEVIRGEAFVVFDETAEGWAWGQLETDAYVGYVPSDALGPIGERPTHRVSALRTFLYPAPDLRLPHRGLLSLGARLNLGGSAETRGTGYLLLAGGAGAVIADHVEPENAPRASDFVAVAERFVGTSYLWGGRTSLGLDCSALVQLSMMAAGKGAPRDADLQEAMLGTPVEGGAAAPLKRGDLVFWRGHVGIMIDGEYMVHASGHQMAVVIEPFRVAAERMAGTAGPPTSVRRL